MRVGIPVEEKKEDAKISSRFGRSPYFAIFDDEKNSVEFCDNPNISSDAHGKGPKTVQLLLDNKVDVIIAKELGTNAKATVEAAGIKVYKAIDGTAKENFEKYKNNELSEL